MDELGLLRYAGVLTRSLFAECAEPRQVKRQVFLKVKVEESVEKMESVSGVDVVWRWRTITSSSVRLGHWSTYGGSCRLPGLQRRQGIR